MASITKINTSNDDTQYFLYDHASTTTIAELKKYINSYGYSIIDNIELYNTAYSNLNDNSSDEIPDNTIIYIDGKDTYRQSGNGLFNIPASPNSSNIITNDDGNTYSKALYYNILAIIIN